MRTRLIAVLVALAAVAVFTTEASAMYHAGMGVFMQRDPGPGAGGPARVGKAGPVVGGRFIPRDQYADGMNLYQYARSRPTRYIDWAGTQAEDLMPQPRFGLRVADGELRAAIIVTMGKICPCLTYEDDGKGRILIKNPHKMDGDKPSKDFCCCYYKNLPGCNLLMQYGYKGGQAPFPVNKDFVVERGANWDGTAVMRVNETVHTFAHEMIHGTFGVTQVGQIGVQAGTHLVDPTGAKDPGEAQNLPKNAANAVKKILGGLIKDMADCKNRPEFSDSPEGATPETTAAMEAYKAHVQKAKEMAERLLQ